MRQLATLAAVLAVLALAACESREPPGACGAIPQVTVNAFETATVAVCFTDPNGDALAYSASSSNLDVATAYLSSLRDTTVTVTGRTPGSATVTVTASDPGGLEARAELLGHGAEPRSGAEGHHAFAYGPRGPEGDGGRLPVLHRA